MRKPRTRRKPSTRTGGKRYDAIAKRLPAFRPTVAVEVGVWKGKNAAGLLPLRPLLTLHLVDRWKTYTQAEQKRDPVSQQPRMTQAQFTAAYAQTKQAVKPFGSRAVIHKQSSAQAAQEFEDGSLDFVFLDGDHSYEGLRDDIQRWLPKVRPGGWIGGHDYNNKRPGIPRAVNEQFDKVELDCNSTWFCQVVAEQVVTECE